MMHFRRRLLKTNILKHVNISFSEGDLPKSQRGVSDNVVFDDILQKLTLTVSNCIIVPGERYSGSERLVDFAGVVGETKLTGNNKIDSETFYFLKDYNQSGNDVATDLSSGDLWAYTFTGWYIKGSSPLVSLPTVSTYVPGQTVFQHGDVITRDILYKNGIVDINGRATGVNLELVALWGKCCFFKTGGNDSNVGNDKASPKATALAVANKLATFNPYSAVGMLVGDYTFSGSVNDSNYAITYKSLQTTDGSRYSLKSSGTGQPNNAGTFRIDNVIGSYTSNRSFKSTGNVSFIETTARFSGKIGQLLRLDNTKQNYVVCFNGGIFTTGEVFGYETDSNFSARYFYFGRNIKYLANLYMSPSGSKGSANGDCYVYFTGGTVNCVKGTTKSTISYSGKRYFYIYMEIELEIRNMTQYCLI